MPLSIFRNKANVSLICHDRKIISVFVHFFCLIIQAWMQVNGVMINYSSVTETNFSFYSVSHHI